jgi:tight adherence protein C
VQIDPRIMLICTFAAIALGSYGAAMLVDPYQFKMRRRVRALADHGDEDDDAAPPVSTLLRRLVDSAVDKDYDRKYIIARFAKAGIYRPAAVSWYFGIKLSLATLALVIGLAANAMGWIAWEPAVIGSLVAASFGSLAPSFWLDRAVQRRHRNLQASLPDFLDLMIICLQGGMSLADTLRRVADELSIVHPDLALELGMVQRDVELGSTIDQALRRFAQRADFEGVRTLSTFVRETQRFGTRLTEALRGHAELLRAQRAMVAEESALKASVKILLPTLLLILPAVFVVLVGPAVIQIQQAFGGK